jgi:isopenicillin-N epimerase
VVPWPAPPRRLLRVSAQLYNEIGQYERLVAALEATGTIRGSAPSGRPGE